MSPKNLQLGCALLKGKIYCFGGFIGPNENTERDTSFYSLDISNVTDNFATKWEEITNSMNSNVASFQPRGHAQVAATSDGKNMIISGGYPAVNKASTPQHLMYNVDSNSWSTLSEFDDSPNGNYRQMYDTFILNITA